jgi:hypothetical protein
MEVLYKDYSFRSYQLTNMAATGKSCFLLVNGLSIDASYQVSVHLAKQFQRRRIFKISQSETRIA